MPTRVLSSQMSIGRKLAAHDAEPAVGADAGFAKTPLHFYLSTMPVGLLVSAA